MGILPSCTCVRSTVQLHQPDPYKMQEEKVRQELHKDASCCSKKKTWKQHLQNSSYKAKYVPQGYMYRDIQINTH